MLIALEVHKDRVKALNGQYHDMFAFNAILDYLYCKQCYFYRLNFRMLPNYVEQQHAQYIIHLSYRSLKILRTVNHLPNRYIYSIGVK